MAFDGTYPAPAGNKPQSVLDVKGPASYVQYAAPFTGGQVISARAFGLSSIEVCWAMGRDSTGAYTPEIVLSPFNANQGSPNVIISWQTPAGAQAAAGANLATATIRLFALGTL